MGKGTDIIYVSDDGRYGIVLKASHIKKILDECIGSLPNETGGILVGKYNERHDLAIVSDILTSPPDSNAGTTWFHRGIKGLKQKLRELWKNNYYYLGEWHFHPFSSPNPSFTDISQIRKISKNKKYQCPEPALLVLGGNPQANFDLEVFVYSTDFGRIRLKQIGC